jgi:putative phosphoribosyl transferase
LARLLSEYAGRPDVIVLGLPRGGVPVANEVAAALSAPLDVFIVRKLGTPGQEELALGAIASGSVRVLNPAVINELGVPEETVNEIMRRERVELERRERAFRGELSPLDVRDRIAILVDDGLATGSTMRAAARALRQMHPSKVVIAVPVAARAVCDSMRSEADEVVCTYLPETFFAVGQWYRNFEQTTDEEVAELLERRRCQTQAAPLTRGNVEPNGN